jgi:hypothetical protein
MNIWCGSLFLEYNALPLFLPASRNTCNNGQSNFGHTEHHLALLYRAVYICMCTNTRIYIPSRISREILIVIAKFYAPERFSGALLLSPPKLRHIILPGRLTSHWEHVFWGRKTFTPKKFNFTKKCRSKKLSIIPKRATLRTCVYKCSIDSTWSASFSFLGLPFCSLNSFSLGPKQTCRAVVNSLPSERGQAQAFLRSGLNWTHTAGQQKADTKPNFYWPLNAWGGAHSDRPYITYASGTAVQHGSMGHRPVGRRRYQMVKPVFLAVPTVACERPGCHSSSAWT